MPEPKVRFKRDDGSSYPAWNGVVLGDIATRITRKNINSETDRPLTIASIEGLVDQRTYFGKTIASKDMSGYFLLKNGEYAYNKSYSAGYDYGSIKRLDKYDMGALSTLYICFALNKDQNSDFYNCYFNGLSWYNQMPQICAEGARNHGLLNVSPNDFFKIRLSVPSSKDEQQKIADFLSSVDEVITASVEEVANLEKQKKAVMKKIFSQEVRFRREDGNGFPGWREEELGTVAFAKVGRKPDQILEETTNYEYINAGTTNSGYVNGYNREGDVTTTPSRGQGGIGFVGYQEKAFWLGPLCYGIQSRVEDVCTKYLYFYLDNNSDSIMGCVKTGSIPAVNQEDLVQIVVNYPCLEEQRLIVDFLSSFDEAIIAAKKELELWKELKKGLLQQMFV